MSWNEPCIAIWKDESGKIHRTNARNKLWAFIMFNDIFIPVPYVYFTPLGMKMNSYVPPKKEILFIFKQKKEDNTFYPAY